MSEDYEVETAVIDIGSNTIKAGLVGEDTPMNVIPSVVGFWKKKPKNFGSGEKEIYIGGEARDREGILNLHYPIEHSVIKNWEEMEKIFHHTFYNELRVSPDEHPFVLTEAPLNSKEDKEKIGKMMFETFDVPALYIQDKASLSLYATNRNTGVVVDCGFDNTSIVPIYEGYYLPYAINNFPLGGFDFTQALYKEIEDRYPEYCMLKPFCYRSEIIIISGIKEKLGYVALDFDEEICKYASCGQEKRYELPDGVIIDIGDSSFKCPEIFFGYPFHVEENEGIHKLIYNSIMKCPEEIRDDLFNNIVLCGGSSLFPGFAERLNKELTSLVPSETKINVIHPSENKYLSFTGGKMVGDYNSLKEKWISKEEYEEYGASIIHRKCL